MAASQMSEVIQHLRGAVLLREGAEPTDGQLLAAYVGRRDEPALAALVRRHGPMVWGVCRRVLRNHHDAEDAFQATFLVLVGKAASIASPELLANWLYGVAHQTALKARATIARRRTRERQVTEMPEPAVTEQDLWSDLQPVLDQELSRLPDIYRIAIVLCDLEGKTRREAARQLGVPDGTLAARLARGRVLLAKRLARHGLAVSAGLLAAVLAQNAASASAPTSVVASTIKAAGLFAAGQAATTPAISVQVAALTQGVLKTMFLTKHKKAIALIALLGLVALGGGLLAQHTAVAQPRPFEKKSEVFQKEDTTQTDLQKLQGTWTLVEAHHHGKKVAARDLPHKDLARKSHQLTVAGEKIALLLKGGGGDAYGKFKLDTTKKPKEIRITWSIIAWFAIYKVDGDTLTICMNEDLNLPLPDEFRTQADSDRLLFVYQRTKPDQDKKGQGVDQRPDLSGTQFPVVSWEYKSLSHDEIKALEFNRRGTDTADGGLNILGKEGWELVAIEPPVAGVPALGGPVGNRPALYVFKRQKK